LLENDVLSMSKSRHRTSLPVTTQYIGIRCLLINSVSGVKQLQ